MTINMNRREFLSSGGALTVAVLLPGLTQQAYAAGTQTSRLGLKPDQLSSYISVNQDGSVVGWVGTVDMGHGTEIGWIMMTMREYAPSNLAKTVADWVTTPNSTSP